MTDTYHHGDLRAELLRRAVEAIRSGDAARLSIREVSRQAGVSHAAHRSYFATRTALLTAVATEGFDLLTAALTAPGVHD